MSAANLFKAGRLQEAIDLQIQAVKAKPADQSERLFLFELLCFAGDLDRARRQVEAIDYGERDLDAAVADYRRLLDAEQSRRRLFSDGMPPRFLTPESESTKLRLDAINRLRENRPAEACEILNKANEAGSALRGTLNEKDFASLRDCDDLFATILEVFYEADYCWVPLEHVKSIAMKPPQFPRDLLWIPAKMELLDGSFDEVYLPALYPGSHQHSDNAMKLGRATDWQSQEGGLVLGVGQRTFLVDDDVSGILEWRQLTVFG